MIQAQIQNNVSQLLPAGLTLIQERVGVKTKYLVECNACGYQIWKARQNLKRPCGQCTGKIGYTNQQLQNMCHVDIQYLEYSGKSQHLLQCKLCLAKFERAANKLDSQCIHCRPDWTSLAIPEDELKALCHKDFTFIGRVNNPLKVLNNSKDILVKCNKCNVERTRSPGSLSQGCQCFAVCYESKSEKELNAWIQSIGLETRKLKLQHKGKITREFDIYIPSKNIAIEFNGLYWHSEDVLAYKFFDKEFTQLTPKEKTQVRNYHLNKTQLAKENGITLLHIWEHEWLERREQVKNFLHSKLGKSQTIGARKCEFKVIDKKTCKLFCHDSHIQGAPALVDLALGAFHNNELIMVTAWAPHHRAGHPQKILNRMCAKFGFNVVGGLSKMTKMAHEHFKCELKTWTHLTLSDGSSYEKAGWTIVDSLDPDYFYSKGQKAYSKQSHKKDCIKVKYPTVYSPNKTEAEMCREAKLSRLWDCGKKTLTYNGKL